MSFRGAVCNCSPERYAMDPILECIGEVSVRRGRRVWHIMPVAQSYTSLCGYLCAPSSRARRTTLTDMFPAEQRSLCRKCISSALREGEVG